MELAAAGEPEGVLVLAERQTRGRGRRDRAWTSPARLGIYTSLLLRPNIPASRAPLFTLMAAVATARGLGEACGLDARIKWPNDVMVAHRKIAGILGEVRGSDPLIHGLVIGIGVNINHRTNDFPPELSRCATSVRMETGSPCDRPSILAAILEQFERRYSALLREGSDGLLSEWRTLSVMPVGTRLVVETSGGRLDGILQGTDTEGALLLDDTTGRTARIPFGEIVEFVRQQS
jgi:BirA family biotin operon repressor/biotin-[acetyl-CoA-carboxylase] ligase